MAIVQNPLISRASGSVGNSIFSKWKNKNTLRSKSINPYPAPTSAQSAVRSKFSAASRYASMLRDSFSFIFRSKSISLSPRNYLIRNLLAKIDNSNFKLPVPSLQSLVLSSGSITPPVTSYIDSDATSFYLDFQAPDFTNYRIYELSGLLIIYRSDLDTFYFVPSTSFVNAYRTQPLLKSDFPSDVSYVFHVLYSNDGLCSSNSFFHGAISY